MVVAKNYSKSSTAKFKFLAVLATILLIGLFLMRFIGLDKDIPNFGISLYQANDEGSYSTMALKLQNYGNLTETTPDGISLSTSATFRANIFGNLAQTLTLFLFGDNYLGFRLPYALAAAATILITLQVIRKCINRYQMGKTGRYLLYGTIIYLLCDFSVLMMGRCVENSVLRSLITAIFLWIWFANEENPIVQYFALGFLGIISIFLVYFSNIHLILLAFILGGWKLYRYLTKRNKYFFKYFVSWLGGILLGLSISELYYRLVWHSGCFENLFMSLGAFSDRISSGSSLDSEHILVKWIKGFVTFWDSNFFFFGITIGIIFFISLLYLAVRAITREDSNLLVITGIVFAFLIQCTFTNDWAERKSISVLPAIVIIVVIGIFFLNSEQRRREIKPWLLRVLLILTAVFAAGLVYSTFRFRWNKGYFIDFEAIDITIWKIGALVQLLASYVVLLCLFLETFSAKEKKAVKLNIQHNIVLSGTAIALSMAIAINIFFSVKYVYFNNLYTERDARIEIGAIADGQYVAGPFSFGYSLYNDIMPVWDSSYYTNGTIDNDSIQYFCDYKNGTYINKINAKGDFQLIQSFPRASEAMGIEYPVAIYQRGRTMQE